MKRTITRIVVCVMIFIIMVFGSGCARCDRFMKSCNSNLSGGLDRIVNIYTFDGQLIATYEGLIDIDDNENGSIMFDMNGKRYVYYNAIIEVIEK